MHEFAGIAGRSAIAAGRPDPTQENIGAQNESPQAGVGATTQERNNLRGPRPLAAAVTTAQPQEAVGQDAASEEGVELVLHELRQIGSGGGFGLGEECRGVLLTRIIGRGDAA